MNDAILMKGNELFHSMFGNTCQVGSLESGWLNRCMEQHPPLECACKLRKLSNVSEHKPQKKVSKLSFGSYLNIVLSARSQAKEYSASTILDFAKSSRTTSCGCAWFKECLKQAGRVLIPFESCCMCWS